MVFWFSFHFFALAALIALWTAKSIFIPRVRTYRKATQIRRLLNPRTSPLRDLLFARAIPNRRLIQAFGITSTFVSEDPKVHKTFTASAKALISAAGSKNSTWRAMALSVEESSHRFLPVQRNVIDFPALVQCITFSVVLSTLFRADLDALHYEDVVHVTGLINRRWQDSKVKDEATMQQDEGSLRSLLAHIDDWIDRNRYPNPLNFILPAYETLWRVVAVTVAYVYCRDNTLYDPVVAFAKDPTEKCFVTFGGDGRQPSMEAIILEVLRLHPPTRHIARAKSVGGSWWWRMLSALVIEIADVEGVHRSGDYGESPTTFDPMRFHPSQMGTRPELFSFGHGRLKCVAATWAPMAAAVIAAAIVAQIGCTVTTGPKIGGRSGWEGWQVSKD